MHQIAPVGPGSYLAVQGIVAAVARLAVALAVVPVARVPVALAKNVARAIRMWLRAPDSALNAAALCISKTLDVLFSLLFIRALSLQWSFWARAALVDGAHNATNAKLLKQLRMPLQKAIGLFLRLHACCVCV